MMTMPRRLAKLFTYLCLLVVTVPATIVLVYAIQARARLPELHAWHTVKLKQEFRAGRSDMPTTFEEYRGLEEQLFADLRRRVLDDPASADTETLSRYNPHSIVASLALDSPYNRSFELVPEGEPRGAALLVHGLSDSPYSMRAIAQTLVGQGYYVLVLRMPGHGTLPSELLDVSWEDWYGAVVLAAKYAVSRVGAEKPFLAGGHSTGAALLTLYSLRSLTDSSLPRPRQLYLVSAAIGVSPFAVLTDFISGLAFVPAFEKSGWMDVLPEYDPYKYNSFPVNAASQIYRLTVEIQRKLDDLVATGLLESMPRVHIFQSIVDATVTANQVARGLLLRLPAGGHELVVFDINRKELLQGLIAPGPIEDLERLRNAVDLPFRVTLVANAARDSELMAEYIREAGASSVTVKELPLKWPKGVFSLGHVSLPFPIDDPVYGLTPATGAGPDYHLGAVVARGEPGALVVGLGAFSRLRSNPFFEVIRKDIIATLAGDGDLPP